MILLLCLLSGLWGTLEGDTSVDFEGDFRHFAVADGTVYVATEERLYQLGHDLTPVHSVTQRGVLGEATEAGAEPFHRVPEGARSNTTFRVNVLLPFAGNRSLISCGVTDDECGYCEVLDPRNISTLLHRERVQVGPLRRSSASVAFLATMRRGNPSSTATYILTAIQQDRSAPRRCDSTFGPINFQNTDDDLRYGGIFSVNEGVNLPEYKISCTVEFGDGFQIGSVVYLLANVRADRGGNQVRLSWLESKKNKRETLKSLRVVTLGPPDGGSSSSSSSSSWLVAASVIPGAPPVLWGGVFARTADRTDTVLAVFDISRNVTGRTDEDLCPKSGTPVKTLNAKAVLLRQIDMSSVLAVREKNWTVFYIGTGDGQLIKLAVDRNYQHACPRVLYRSDDDNRVLPGMRLDQVDPKHLYVPYRKKMKRVAVARCSAYADARACWSAQDPHCVWCGPKDRCTFEDECEDSDWLSIPDVKPQRMVSYTVTQDSAGKLALSAETHVTAGRDLTLSCQFSVALGELCSRDGPPAQFPHCGCSLVADTLPAGGLRVTVKMRLGSSNLREQVKMTNCSEISGPPTSALCQQCLQAGCGWSDTGCTWANRGVFYDSVCQGLQSGPNFPTPEITSITPNVVSFYGKNHAQLSGRRLGNVTGVRMQVDLDCVSQESPVWASNDTALTFHIPPIKSKGVVKVCLLLPDGSCHGSADVTVRSSPSCFNVTPESTWMSGGREITLKGSHMEFVDGVSHSHAPQQVQRPGNGSSQSLAYRSPAAASGVSSSSVFLNVANETLICAVRLAYRPDPEFTGFTSTKTGDNVQITIRKKADELNVSRAELSVWGQQGNKPYPCIMENKETSDEIEYFTCEIRSAPVAKFQRLLIRYGNKSVILEQKSSLLLLVLLVLLLVPLIIVAAIVIYKSQQKKLDAKMNRFVEDLELDIRADIRQGFVDLQTEKADLMENVGAIPFLDYKHFASRIFFPESEPLMALCLRDMGQDVVKVPLDECSQGLSKLIQNQVFLTSMVHALEEQKSFTIKDKCAFASLLTVALHGDLLYLTEVMEVLLKDLMQQSSNAQPKLLLRRTESIVEKLLTNWMSICLYGFLRESVGQHLFLMVSALTQAIAKGPVDCVTEKALYTLSEDWLLWQAPEFSSLKLQVLFAVGIDGGVSEPLEVRALSCDTVEQVKEKILSTFKAKFGFPYNTSLRDARIEYEKDGTFVPLEEVDASSEVVGEVTMLNTLEHYKVHDGATIKVLSGKDRPPLSPQGSLKDDENFSGKYFHLIDPDVVEDQRKNPERKKLKVKEVHLTKLLSTKVAVHSFVENLFSSIWGLSHSKPPHAVVYFFNFLDAQADCMKITDPDVLHIWKTNSLPLRFWINILKNPQFVFDMEKSPHLDGCLSVIAQAFMDSFSLSETQLGKHAPTNKLLYAKDIPKYKQEVKAYYKQIRDQSAITETQLKEFLREESKKHENEFNEAAALRELYKYIQRYFTEIKEKLDHNGAPVELAEQLQHVKDSFDGLKSCSWN